MLQFDIARRIDRELSEAGSRTRSLVVVLACVGGAKLFVTAIMAIAGLLYSQAEIDSQYGGSGVALLQAGWERLLLGVWQREDAIWYQKIAEVGYSTQDMTQEFFPLFPMSMRLVTWITGLHPVSAGMIISELSILLALYLLHRLILPGFGARTADRTVLYISIFPTAFSAAPSQRAWRWRLPCPAFYLMRSGRWCIGCGRFLVRLSRPRGCCLPALAMEQISGPPRVGVFSLDAP